jgi:hypothetical protein
MGASSPLTLSVESVACPPRVAAAVPELAAPTPTPLAHAGDVEGAASALLSEKFRSGNATNNVANSATTTTGPKPLPRTHRTNLVRS